MNNNILNDKTKITHMLHAFTNLYIIQMKKQDTLVVCRNFFTANITFVKFFCIMNVIEEVTGDVKEFQGEEFQRV